MSTKTLTTVEQFAQMRTGDTEDYELVDGELIPLSSGTPRHNLIRDLLGQYSSLKNISVLICSRAQPLLEMTHEHEAGGVGHIGGDWL